MQLARRVRCLAPPGALVVLAVACGSGKPAAAPVGPAKSAKDKPLTTMVTPASLVPEIDTDAWQPRFRRNGKKQYMLGGLRIETSEDGRVERSSQRFPGGSVFVRIMPERFGGGYLFHQSDSQGTRLWRADDWVGTLKALTYLLRATEALTIGFDRLYLRSRYNKMVAIDADSGELRALGQLPPASDFGHMAFADGWRGIVDTDLRGPVASFDAGATWRSLQIGQHITGAAVLDGDPVLHVSGGYYRLDVRGRLQFISNKERAKTQVFGALTVPDEDESTNKLAEDKQDRHPLGKRVLRAAIERGWPETKTSVIVAHEGDLVRIRLPAGTVEAVRQRAFPEKEASCQGVQVGKGFGFICGEPKGDTVVYAFESPLALRELARFDEPRFVGSSGNGALVIRGKCDDTKSPPKLRNYCIIKVDGSKREIGVKGELGAERVVGLEDGRVVVLVPPRSGTAGRLTVISGSKLKSAELVFPEEPRRAVKVARRGLWLESFEQRSKDTIGGWVEAGGPVVGVQVKLDGKVEVGKVYDEGGDVVFSGKFALAVADTEEGLESTDGGKTWTEFEMPRLPESAGDAKTRACSPVGCAVRSWLRVGWGEPAVKDDLETVLLPDPVDVASTSAVSTSLTCRLAKTDPKAKEAKTERPPPGTVAPHSTWSAFRGAPPPKLIKGQIGVDKGTHTYNAVPAHGYAWGPKGADWTRAGWWQVRFHDRFASSGGVRLSANTRSPWPDQAQASEAIGAKRYGGYWRWHAVLEPSGKFALISICRSGSSSCKMYSVGEGRPVLPLRTTPYARRPSDNGAVRVGEAWYYLLDSGTSGLELWRADSAQTAKVKRYRRVSRRRYSATPTVKLVRRAIGGEVGFLISVSADASSGSGVDDWVVLPIDPKDGHLGEPIKLMAATLHPPMTSCHPHEDGWLVDIRPQSQTVANVRGASGYLHQVEYRLRLSPSSYCVEAIAGIAGRGFTAYDGPRPEIGDAADMLIISAREQYGKGTWQLECWDKRNE